MSLIQTTAQRLQGLFKKQVATLSDDAGRAIRGSSDDLARKAGQVFGDDVLKLSKTARPAKVAEEFTQALAQRGLKPVQPLHPRVQAQWAQSRANASRYKEETLQVLTEKFGSRAKAEAKYEALYKATKKKMYMAANYSDGSFVQALRDGRLKSSYELPLKTQLQKKGPGYVASRNIVDIAQGLRKDNPLYVTIAGNNKFAKDIAKYGNMTVRYNEADLAARTLFSDGNHNHIFREDLMKRLKPIDSLRQKQFTWFDAPHLVINRIVKEGLDPKTPSRLIEGLVFDGINPRTAAEGVKVLKDGPQVAAVLDEARKLGWKID